MNLQELEQVKKDLANGIIISRQTWAKVLETAIEASDVKNQMVKNAKLSLPMSHPNDPPRYPAGMEPPMAPKQSGIFDLWRIF